MSFVGMDYVLRPPYRNRREGEKTYWSVPVLIVIYPTDKMTELAAVVRFLDPGGRGSDSDIVEFGCYSAEMYEESREEYGHFIERQYGVVFRSSAGAFKLDGFSSPSYTPTAFAVWIEKQAKKSIHDFFKRVEGWKNTGIVDVYFRWQLQAGD